MVEVSLGAQRFVTEDGPTIGATLGASVSLPFTARRVNRLSSEAADRAVRAARVSRQAAVAEVRAALGSAVERYHTAREQLALYDAALLRGAREERESALASYRSGELSLLELLDFERALTRAEINRLRSRIAAVDALTDLVAGDGTSAADDSDLSGLLSEVQ
jgi:cobalt-zinc-cadmium efflux system outer membrane protein